MARQSIGRAVASALPGIPHQLCQFHYLREAAKLIYEADRHAKKELKKTVRGVRPLERAVEGRAGPEAEVTRGYCLAVRSALTDDGRPPLCADGLKLRERLDAIDASLGRLAEKGAAAGVDPAPGHCCQGAGRDRGGLAADPDRLRLDPPGRAGSWRTRRAAGGEVRPAWRSCSPRCGATRRPSAPLAPAVAHFLKVSASYWPGLFHCYDIPGLPRTNNDLEQYFGSARYHQRRASGRIHASAATVVRGAVRVLACHRQSPPPVQRVPLAPPRPGALAAAPPGAGAAPRGAAPTGSLPPKPRPLPRPSGDHLAQVEFAVLVFFGRTRGPGW